MTQISPQSESLSQVLEELRHPDISQLREKVTIFKRLSRSVSGFPIARPDDCRRITDALGAFLIKNKRYFSSSDPLMSKYFLSLIDDFMNSDIKAYPNEVAHLHLVQAEAMFLIGKTVEAIDILTPMAEKPYLIEGDFGTISKLFALDTMARLAEGRIQDVENVAIGRLIFLVKWQKYNSIILFEDFYPSIAIGKIWGRKCGVIEKLIRICAQLRLIDHYRHNKSIFIRIFYHSIALFARIIGGILLYIHSYALSGPSINLSGNVNSNNSTIFLRVYYKIKNFFSKKEFLQHENTNFSTIENLPTNHDILITRAMGGLGDIIMMTPGIHALAKKYNRPIYFATKKQFFPILENNPDIRLIDIDSVFDVGVFKRWYNLSICPASNYETKVAPRIRKSRVETFAKGMAVSRRKLNQFGWQPRYFLSEHQINVRDSFVTQHKINEMPIVGVQPFSRDTYKNYPGIFEAISKLAEHYKIVVMHSSSMPLPEHPNIIPLFGQPLRDTIGILSGCDYFVAVDSAFYHVAAAFNVPTLGLFGPTDGNTLSQHHPAFALVDTPVAFPCAPCWRNEDSPCRLTGANNSACLASIPAQKVVDDFHALVRDVAENGRNGILRSYQKK